MESGIYSIKNVNNGKSYIGSSKDIEARFIRHLRDLKNGKHHNIYLQRSWDKHGEDEFEFIIIEYCDVEDLKNIEQLYLNVIFENVNHNDLYYNIGKQSTGGDNISNNPNRETIIKKISNAVKNRYENMSDLERKLYSEKLSGENNPNYGNKWSVELRKKVSVIRKELAKDNDNYIKGKTWEEYHGVKKSDLLRINLSNIASERIGDKNPFYGKNHSDETKKKIGESNRNKVNLSQLKPFVIDGVEFLTLSEAYLKLGIHCTTIRYRIISDNIKYSNYNYITDINALIDMQEKYNEILR